MVTVSKFYSRKIREGAAPSNPGNVDQPDAIPPVLNPPGSGVPSYITLSDTKDGNYLGKNGFVPVVTTENGLKLEPLPQVAENGLISGGIVQWSGVGYIFNVSGAFYRIGGILYESPAVQITLDAPDATNNRIDVFAVSTSGVAVDITGTPSGSPVKPQIDPSTQLELTSVIVTASSTEPTLTEEVIYDENTEWTGTKSGTGTANFASTNDPYQGTVSVETTNIQNAFYIEFDNGSTIDVSGFQTLGFQLKLKSAMPANQNLIGILIDGSGNPASSSFNLNFDKFSTDYQFVGLVMAGIPIVDFNIRYLRIVFIRTSGSPTYSGFFLDILKFEGGINPPQTVGSFLGLSDTPSTYSGQASKVVSVKADESGLEFTTVSSGGVQSVTGDGVDNTDPENPVIDLADIATSGSPYDLAQEGATDGDVLTWVAANSRYEPIAGGGGGITGSGTTNEIAYFTGATAIASLSTATYPSLTELSYVKGVTSSIQTQLNTLGSKWTNGVGFIYRNGPVVIGDTVWSNDTSLTIKGNSAPSSWVLKVQDSAGSNLIQVLNDRRLSLFSDIINIGNSPSGSSGVTIKSFYSSTQPVLQLQDSSGNIIYNIGANGESYFRSSRVNYGLPSGAPTTGLTIKVPGTGFTNAHTIQDSSNAINIRLFANGSVYTEGTRHSFGPISGSITDGAHFKGASTGTNPQFAVDNSAATRLLSILGNGDISFSEGRGFIFGTTTGWKLATATTQKLAFWNKTPIIQPTTAITGATLVGGGGTTITDTDTFGGYTLQQIAAALINTGLLE